MRYPIEIYQDNGADDELPPPKPRKNNGAAPDRDPLADIRAAIAADLSAGPAAIDAATPPRFVSHPRLPAAGANIAGSGGAGKTVCVLNEKVHVTSGHELYGSPVDIPGACVLVTAEDGAGYARYVLQQVLRDGIECGGLPERVAERAKREILIIGWDRARYGSIVTADAQGKMSRAPVYDLLMELLQPISPVYVTLDPSVLFSPGERYGNDGDAYLAAMLHDSALTLGACVQVIDHVSQSVARAGIVDQYAARGGTAKTDNARLARQLVRVDAKTAAEMAVPLAISAQDLAQGRVLLLHTTKSNYAPLPPPVWLRRRRYWMEWLQAPHAKQRAEAIQQDQSDRLQRDVAAVVEHIRTNLTVGKGVRNSQREIEESLRSLPDGSRITRARVRDAIKHALAVGILAYKPLPDEERRGQRREYLSTPDLA